MGKLRKMNKATGVYLLKDYGITGIKYMADKKPDRYICSCGCVHNVADGVCPDCGNNSYITIQHSYYSGRYRSGSDHIRTREGELFSNRDDPTIPIGKALCKMLVLTANDMTETFEIEEIYGDFIAVSDDGIITSRQTGLDDLNLLDVIEDREANLFSTYQHELWQGAKEMLRDWGLVALPSKENYGDANHIAKLSAFMKFLNRKNHKDFDIPPDDLWKYRGLVWAAFNRNKLEKMTSIDGIIQNMGFMHFMKPFYVYDISGMKNDFSSYYYSRSLKDEAKLSIFVKNSLLFAVHHGQVSHSQAIGIAEMVSNWPDDKQEVFVEFFGKHIAALTGNVLQTFESVWTAYNNLPTKPSKFDLKTVSACETAK